MRGMSGKTRRARNWSWDEARLRTLAIYRSDRDGRELTAVLVWQGNEPRLTTDDGNERLLVVTVDAEQEAGLDNTIAIAAFDSLERARAHCFEWAGTADETDWDALGEAAQVGVYAALREPGFAERG